MSGFGRFGSGGAAFLFVLAAASATAAEGHSVASLVSELDPIEVSATAEIAAGRIPGAVVVIGDRDKTLYRRAFGNRALQPEPAPMTVDTIFDLASLTKVVATATAVMQLVEQGKLKLDSPAARYWPQFGVHGKAGITVRQLLVHYSGLRAGLDLRQEWTGYDTAMDMIVADKPLARPGSRYGYSDVNFLVLGELVRRVSGSTLEVYCRERIFQPLGMADTEFLPARSLRRRIAPTQDLPGRTHWGEVHDATARWMGGVAGSAGLFSTADDLAIYARMILGGGTERGTRILARKSVNAMAARQSPPHGPHERGLGWDRGARSGGFSLFSDGAYGHLGYTGTMVWIDPAAGVYAVVLTNRSYPDGKGDAGPFRRAVVETLMDAIRRSIGSAAGRSG